MAVAGGEGIARSKGEGRHLKKASPIELLRKLCAYYLDCLALEAAGVVVELKRKPVFLELPSVDFLGGPGVPAKAPDGLEPFLKRAHGFFRPNVFLGYPTLLSFNLKLEPIITPVILWSLEAHPGAGLIRFSELPPTLNLAALKALPGLDTGSAIDESLLLGDLLQLDAMTGGASAVEALGKALHAARPGWTWIEAPDASTLNVLPPLQTIVVPGLYNRAVLAAVEKEIYTLGLERELRDLALCEAGDLEGTALAHFLSGAPKDLEPGRRDDLLQPAPLNEEQLEAVHRALVLPVVPVTGPPGTGKSQVVTGILVNAAHSGQSALFASKNNKAVEVVEQRVNALTTAPSLLRLGLPDQNVLVADRLDAVLAAATAPIDLANHKAAVGVLTRLYEAERLAAEDDETLRAKRDRVIRLATETDGLRSSMSPAGFSAARTSDPRSLSDDFQVLSAALAEATRSRQPWYRRALWPFLRRSRFERLAAEGSRFGGDRLPGEPPPARAPDDLTLPLWGRWVDRIAERLGAIEKAKAYHDALDGLGTIESAQKRARADRVRAAEIVRWSGEAWETWLRVLPHRLKPADIAAIGTYLSALKADIDAKAGGKRPGKEVTEAIRKSFPGVLKALPCWAVTSLSARGRIPFRPGLFDILVLDEASQSDVASLLPLLLRAKKAVVIGDPMQLRHITAITAAQEKALCKKHGIDHGLQDWRYSVTSAWDRSASTVLASSKTLLRDHHRSHADIIEFSNQSFYDGMLRVMTRTENLKRPDEGPVVEWIDVKGNPVRPHEGGVVNELEARAVVSTLERLLVTQGFDGSVGVTSPFRKQADRIQELVGKHYKLKQLAEKASLTVRTVHQFQGDERDVIVLSPGVNGDGPGGALTFLRRNAYLFNVAVTRARAKLIIVGDRAGASLCGVEYLQRFVAWADRVEKAAATVPLDPACLGPAYPDDPAFAPRCSSVEALYVGLYEAGLRPIPRFPLDSLTVDLALIGSAKRLAIEVLGEGELRPWLDEDVKEMRRRVRRLVELGWEVETVWPWEIRDRLPECVERIRQAL